MGYAKAASPVQLPQGCKPLGWDAPTTAMCSTMHIATCHSGIAAAAQLLSCLAAAAVVTAAADVATAAAAISTVVLKLLLLSLVCW